MNVKMYSAAREATTKARNVASAIQQVQRQVNDDNKDVMQKVDKNTQIRSKVKAELELAAAATAKKLAAKQLAISQLQAAVASIQTLVATVGGLVGKQLDKKNEKEKGETSSNPEVKKQEDTQVQKKAAAISRSPSSAPKSSQSSGPPPKDEKGKGTGVKSKDRTTPETKDKPKVEETPTDKVKEEKKTTPPKDQKVEGKESGTNPLSSSGKTDKSKEVGGTTGKSLDDKVDALAQKAGLTDKETQAVKDALHGKIGVGEKDSAKVKDLQSGLKKIAASGALDGGDSNGKNSQAIEKAVSGTGEDRTTPFANGGVDGKFGDGTQGSVNALHGALDKDTGGDKKTVGTVPKDSTENPETKEPTPETKEPTPETKEPTPETKEPTPETTPKEPTAKEGETPKTAPDKTDESGPRKGATEETKGEKGKGVDSKSVGEAIASSPEKLGNFLKGANDKLTKGTEKVGIPGVGNLSDLLYLIAQLIEKARQLKGYKVDGGVLSKITNRLKAVGDVLTTGKYSFSDEYGKDRTAQSFKHGEANDVTKAVSDTVIKPVTNAIETGVKAIGTGLAVAASVGDRSGVESVSGTSNLSSQTEAAISDGNLSASDEAQFRDSASAELKKADPNLTDEQIKTRVDASVDKIRGGLAEKALQGAGITDKDGKAVTIAKDDKGNVTVNGTKVDKSLVKDLTSGDSAARQKALDTIKSAAGKVSAPTSDSTPPPTDTPETSAPPDKTPEKTTPSVDPGLQQLADKGTISSDQAKQLSALKTAGLDVQVDGDKVKIGSGDKAITLSKDQLTNLASDLSALAAVGGQVGDQSLSGLNNQLSVSEDGKSLKIGDQTATQVAQKASETYGSLTQGGTTVQGAKVSATGEIQSNGEVVGDQGAQAQKLAQALAQNNPTIKLSGATLEGNTLKLADGRSISVDDKGGATITSQSTEGARELKISSSAVKALTGETQVSDLEKGRLNNAVQAGLVLSQSGVSGLNLHFDANAGADKGKTGLDRNNSVQLTSADTSAGVTALGTDGKGSSPLLKTRNDGGGQQFTNQALEDIAQGKVSGKDLATLGLNVTGGKNTQALALLATQGIDVQGAKVGDDGSITLKSGIKIDKAAVDKLNTSEKVDPNVLAAVQALGVITQGEAGKFGNLSLNGNGEIKVEGGKSLSKGDVARINRGDTSGLALAENARVQGRSGGDFHKLVTDVLGENGLSSGLGTNLTTTTTQGVKSAGQQAIQDLKDQASITGRSFETAGRNFGQIGSGIASIFSSDSDKNAAKDIPGTLKQAAVRELQSGVEGQVFDGGKSSQTAATKDAAIGQSIEKLKGLGFSEEDAKKFIKTSANRDSKGNITSYTASIDSKALRSALQDRVQVSRQQGSDGGTTFTASVTGLNTDALKTAGALQKNTSELGSLSIGKNGELTTSTQGLKEGTLQGAVDQIKENLRGAASKGINKLVDQKFGYQKAFIQDVNSVKLNEQGQLTGLKVGGRDVSVSQFAEDLLTRTQGAGNFSQADVQNLANQLVQAVKNPSSGQGSSDILLAQARQGGSKGAFSQNVQSALGNLQASGVDLSKATVTYGKDGSANVQLDVNTDKLASQQAVAGLSDLVKSQVLGTTGKDLNSDQVTSVKSKLAELGFSQQEIDKIIQVSKPGQSGTETSGHLDEAALNQALASRIDVQKGSGTATLKDSGKGLLALGGLEDKPENRTLGSFKVGDSGKVEGQGSGLLAGQSDKFAATARSVVSSFSIDKNGSINATDHASSKFKGGPQLISGALGASGVIKDQQQSGLERFNANKQEIDRLQKGISDSFQAGIIGTLLGPSAKKVSVSYDGQGNVNGASVRLSDGSSFKLGINQETATYGITDFKDAHGNPAAPTLAAGRLLDRLRRDGLNDGLNRGNQLSGDKLKDVTSTVLGTEVEKDSSGKSVTLQDKIDALKQQVAAAGSDPKKLRAAKKSLADLRSTLVNDFGFSQKQAEKALSISTRRDYSFLNVNIKGQLKDRVQSTDSGLGRILKGFGADQISIKQSDNALIQEHGDQNRHNDDFAQEGRLRFTLKGADGKNVGFDLGIAFNKEGQNLVNTENLSNKQKEALLLAVAKKQDPNALLKSAADKAGISVDDYVKQAGGQDQALLQAAKDQIGTDNAIRSFARAFGSGNTGNDAILGAQGQVLNVSNGADGKLVFDDSQLSEAQKKGRDDFALEALNGQSAAIQAAKNSGGKDANVVRISTLELQALVAQQGDEKGQQALGLVGNQKIKGTNRTVAQQRELFQKTFNEAFGADENGNVVVKDANKAREAQKLLDQTLVSSGLEAGSISVKELAYGKAEDGKSNLLNGSAVAEKFGSIDVQGGFDGRPATITASNIQYISKQDLQALYQQSGGQFSGTDQANGLSQADRFSAAFQKGLEGGQVKTVNGVKVTQGTDGSRTINVQAGDTKVQSNYRSALKDQLPENKHQGPNTLSNITGYLGVALNAALPGLQALKKALEDIEEARVKLEAAKAQYLAALKYAESVGATYGMVGDTNGAYDNAALATGTEATGGTGGVQGGQGTQGAQGNQGVQNTQGAQGSQGSQSSQNAQESDGTGSVGGPNAAADGSVSAQQDEQATLLEKVASDANFANVAVLIGLNPGMLIEQAQQNDMLENLAQVIEQLQSPFGNPIQEMQRFVDSMKAQSDPTMIPNDGIQF